MLLKSSSPACDPFFLEPFSASRSSSQQAQLVQSAAAAYVARSLLPIDTVRKLQSFLLLKERGYVVSAFKVLVSKPACKLMTELIASTADPACPSEAHKRLRCSDPKKLAGDRVRGRLLPLPNLSS